MKKRENFRELELKVNSKTHRVTVQDSWLLLRVLRDQLGLTGTKHGCGKGECGACTVLIDGKAVNSCLVLAVETEGSEITTIEGLAKENELHPVQRAFIDHFALQCGFCTPGMIMSAFALLKKRKSPSEEEIKKALKGNLCRCGAYANIIKAVKSV